MLGTGKEIRTLYVRETADKNIDQVINEALNQMANREIVDIKVMAGEEVWHSALIIYKVV
ncbi:hypothetical protein [Paenibacillus sp. Marseille-Q4541]|uniref:hypothetical protein n=1 Tax=Paenibacillus sp. Marseille-Q4541 TaxID=2831522 RepID=UPI001BAE3903|nr:hypothetical protein [Paenibacillus sp. Marseille-Q4541]